MKSFEIWWLCIWGNKKSHTQKENIWHIKPMQVCILHTLKDIHRYRDRDKKHKHAHTTHTNIRNPWNWMNESINWIPQNEIERPNRLLRPTVLIWMHEIWNRTYVHDFVCTLTNYFALKINRMRITKIGIPITEIILPMN